jgi:hypothetical protein
MACQPSLRFDAEHQYLVMLEVVGRARGRERQRIYRALRRAPLKSMRRSRA